jgi:uncharacterized protein
MIASSVVLFIGGLIAFGLSMVCGGGASIILIPLLGTILPRIQVPAALSLGTASNSFSRIIIFRNQIQWKIVAWFVIPSLPFAFGGIWLLTYINPIYLELFIGLFLISNLPLIFDNSEKKADFPLISKPFLLLIGAAAGFISGLSGAVGLLFNRFYLRYGLNKEEIIATRAANELLLHVIKVGIYFYFGLINAQVLGFGTVIAISALLSTWLMKWVFPLISQKLFEKIGFTAMVLSGFLMLGTATKNLIIENQFQLSLNPLESGIESKLHWQKSSFALEFEFNEGIEIERAIQLKDLPLEKQALYLSYYKTQKVVLIEEVIGLGKHYYELYLYKNGKLVAIEI